MITRSNSRLMVLDSSSFFGPPATASAAKYALCAVLDLGARLTSTTASDRGIHASGKAGPIPRQLQNKHYDGEDAAVKGQHYLYPHDYPGSWVDQQYLPDALRNAAYYVPGNNKNEQAYQAYWAAVREKYGK